MAPPRESFSPNAANTTIYARINESVYPTIRTATDPLYERAFPIFH